MQTLNNHVKARPHQQDSLANFCGNKLAFVMRTHKADRAAWSLDAHNGQQNQGCNALASETMMAGADALPGDYVAASMPLQIVCHDIPGIIMKQKDGHNGR